VSAPGVPPDRKGRVRALLRRVVPPAWRKAARSLAAKAGDFSPLDARDRLPAAVHSVLRLPRESVLPPPHLRFRACGSRVRANFLSTGGGAADDVLASFEACRRPNLSYGRWLDFGCGCGRVARHLLRSPHVEELWGVDVDGDAVDWCARHLRGRFFRIGPEPPTPLPSASFEAVYAGSVFTHLDEAAQERWLGELHRVTKPGALVIASTHGPRLSWIRPDLTPDAARELDQRGFLFAPGSGPFNADTAFHAEDYLKRVWGRFFTLRDFRPHGLTAYQDLAVWERP